MLQSNSLSQQRFPLGQIVATPGALEALHRNQQDATTFLTRHAAGDWGEIGAEDTAANNDAVDAGERLLSAYSLNDQTRLWIITEANREVTTLLLPEEY